eukprot:TRINITY_DN12188_c0_g2_i1.p1 TRINITY_DN12188_c0_g2~~TRINITY_DN12188_c0_g2_i1.p1  ORF type:complete len:274 (-),score=51.13 TRINITY_DN12188_c0_g2_i1:94-840(-)
MIAVLGAGGPTGLECIRALAASGTPVRAVVRNVNKYAGKFPDACEVVCGDVTDESSLRTALAGCKGVVFAASASTYRGPGGPWQVDYLGVEKATHAAGYVGVARFVLVSSRLVNPSNRCHPIRILLNNIKYSLMDYKFKGEQALRTSGLEYVIVRPGGLKGGEGSGPQARPSDTAPGAEYIIAAGPEGDVQGSQSIHRADVAAVVCEALRSADAKNKTIEIVSRPRTDADPTFENRLQNLFASIQPER